MKSLLKEHKVLTKNDLLKINGGYGGSSGGGSGRGYSGCSSGGSSSSGYSVKGLSYCTGTSSNRVSYSSSSSGGSTSTRLDYGKISALEVTDDMKKLTCPGFSYPMNPISELKF